MSISSEMFCAARARMHYKYLKLLARQFDTIRVIYYVRRRDDFLMSALLKTCFLPGRLLAISIPSAQN